MLRRAVLLVATLALLLGACSRTNPSAPEVTVPPTVDGPALRGLAEVTFSDLSLERDTFSSQVTFHPLPGAEGQALTPVSGGLELGPATSGSFTYNGSVTTDNCTYTEGTRFLFASYPVRNADTDGTAYTVDRTNLTFLAINNGGDYGDNAVAALRDAGGNLFPVDTTALTFANCLKPTHQTDEDTNGEPQVNANGADMQVFSEAELSGLNIVNTGNISNVFPYGYVVRDIGGGRTLGADPPVGQFDGVITFAIRVPNSTTNFPQSFSLWFYVFENDETFVTEDITEQGDGSAETRADALGATTPIRLLGTSPTAPTTNPTVRLCQVRTAGPAAAPTGYLVAESGVICDFPDGRIYVDKSATGNADGSSWADAFTNLSDALEVARSSTIKEIWIANGTYYPDEGDNVTVVTTDTGTDPDTVVVTTGPANDNRNVTFYVPEDIKIYGGFAGSETSLSQRDPDANVVTLSGDIDKNNAFGSNAYHVFYLDGVTNVAIDNVTITAGQADEFGGADSFGGAMYNTSSSPTLTNITFSDNTARGGGAMANISNSNPTLTNVTFSGNSASNGGAMVNATGSSPTLTNVTFLGNTAEGNGGAISNNFNGRATLINVTFSGNTARFSGGAIYNVSVGSRVRLTNVVLWGNSANSGSQISHDNTSTGSLVINYSIVQGGNSGIVDASGGTAFNDGTGNIDANPNFVDAPSGNLRLGICSPAIDAGDSGATTFLTDLAGQPRFVDDAGVPDAGAGGTPRIDIGAFERQLDSGVALPSNVRVVDNDALISGDGRFWCRPYRYMQDALADARSDSSIEEIWVAAGTYYPDNGAATNSSGNPLTNPDNDRNATFAVPSGVKIYGGFSGIEGDPSARTFSSGPTIFSGDIDQGTAANAYHVFYLDGVTNVTIDSVTITAGQADGFSNDRGGAMHNVGSSPTLTNVTFSDNTAGEGGAMYNDSSSPTLTNVTFSDNSAEEFGGGAMYNDSSSPTLTNVTFSNNTALSETVADGGQGGAMYNRGGSPTLTDVTFSDNSAFNGGGAMHNVGSSPTLTDVTFSGNTALGGPLVADDGKGGAMSNLFGASPTLTNVTFSDNSGFEGGAMYSIFRSSPTLTDVTFSDNRASNGGAMYNVSRSNPTLTDVTFSDNLGFEGGAMVNADSSPTLNNVTFSGNSASSGGAMYNFTNSSPTLTNVTFSSNSASGDGGAMFNSGSSPTLTNVTFTSNSANLSGGAMYNSNSSSPTLTNVILWGNTATNDGSQVYQDGGTLTISYSIVQDGDGGILDTSGSSTAFSNGADNLNADPLFVNAPSNLRLAAGSPAIDAGDNGSLPQDITDLDGDGNTTETLPLDLDNTPRVVDGNNDSTATVDMGAYEFQP